MEEKFQTFNNRFKYLLVVYGIKGNQLSKKTRVSETNISRYAKGPQLPNALNNIALSQYFKRDWHWVLSREGEPPSQESVTNPHRDTGELPDNIEQISDWVPKTEEEAKMLSDLRKNIEDLRQSRDDKEKIIKDLEKKLAKLEKPDDDEKGLEDEK